MEGKKCALYGCDNPVKSWRMSCCCRSHLSKHAAKVRHGTENKPNAPQRSPKIKKEKLHYEFGFIVVKKKDRKYVTPKWADKKKMKEIYDRARLLSEETGVKHEVDHIIPLKNELVCGLHVETNLRIVTKEENRRKRNIFYCEETVLI
jgi:hypothetical protein